MMSLPGQLTGDEPPPVSTLPTQVPMAHIGTPFPPHSGRRAHKARLSFNKQIKLAVCAVFGAYFLGALQ